MNTVLNRIISWRLAWKAPALLAMALLATGWLLNTPPGLLGKADAIGYAVCHRIDARSFHLGERQLPLCVRCTGMYLGAVLGLFFHAQAGRRLGGNAPRRVWLALGALALAFAVDGTNSYLHFFPGFGGLYEPQNWLRLATGMGMGIAISAALYPAFVQTVWADWQPKPAIPNLRTLGLLVLLAAGLAVLASLENPLILYPLAIISAAGVLVVLSMVYSMAWLIVLRRESLFVTWRQLVIPIMAGFGMALLQIAILDLGRYWLTGTWDGFHIG